MSYSTLFLKAPVTIFSKFTQVVGSTPLVGSYLGTLSENIGFRVILGTGIVYGGYKGICSWSKYLDTRKPFEITGMGDFDNAMSGVANATADAGTLVFDVLVYSTACGLVTATAPISVPLIIYFKGNRTKNE